MDDYLCAMFLAEDIIKCVLKNHGIEWEARNSIRHVYKGKFPPKIVILSLEKAVVMFIEKNPKQLIDILRDYTADNAPTVNEFCLYSIEFGSELFKNGFDPTLFIKYSAAVAELAYRLYDHCQDIPEHAAGVIGTVLVSQIMTLQFEESGGQEGLKKAAFKLLDQLKRINTRIDYTTTSV